MGIWEYPSQLNFSALRFECCVECHEPSPKSSSTTRRGPLRSNSPCSVAERDNGGYRREKSDKRKRRDKQKIASLGEESEKCLNSILGDDLILCRLSALLSPMFDDDPAKEGSSLLREVSSSDDDEAYCDAANDNGSASASPRRPAAFTLIPGDAVVVLPAILPHSGTNEDDNVISNPVQSLLSTVGIEEVEALDPSNGGPSAGQCQFACVASALSKSFGVDRPLRDGYRPDLELRSLALHTVRMNPDMYRDFMTVAGGRTRKQNSAGGSSVDLNTYLRNMSSPSCDGDAVTLQALCDALKITVRIVKPVDADAYDEQRQRERLCAASSSGRLSLGSEDDDEGADDDDGASSTTSASSVSSSISAISWVNNPYTACAHFGRLRRGADSKHGHSRGHRPQRLYISQEICPRRLPRVDSRIRDVQRVARGRLLWLSHIGNEAHYRFLRPAAMPPLEGGTPSPTRESTHCPQGRDPCNEEEAAIARLSRMRRHRQLRGSRSLEDGYARLYKGDTQSALHDEESYRKLRQRCMTDLALSPHCGLCFEAFFRTSADATEIPVSPSCCHHDYCSGCIMSWTEGVGNSCPTCGCLFMALVDSLSGRVVHSLASDCVTMSGEAFNLNSLVYKDAKMFEREEGSSSGMDDEEDSRLSGDLVRQGMTNPLSPPPLSSSFIAQVDLSMFQVALTHPQDRIEDDSPAVILQGLSVELAKDQHADANAISQLLSQLSSLLNQEKGLFECELLESGLLRTLRLLLTPVEEPSPGRETAIRVGESDRFIIDPTLFLKSIDILDRTTSFSSSEDARKILPLTMMRRSFGLPKLLLWFIACNPYEVAAHHKAVNLTRLILSRWSKSFGFSLIDALQRFKSLNTNRKKAPSSAKSSKKKAAATSVGSSPQKKRKSGSGSKSSSKRKRVKHASWVEKEKAVAALIEQQQPDNSVQRAAGKRQVRPVASFNISREQLGVRTYGC